MAEADDNWLDAEVVACPGCGERLFAVVHLPMCDDHRLYCDRCPRAIEVRGLMLNRPAERKPGRAVRIRTTGEYAQSLFGDRSRR